MLLRFIRRFFFIILLLGIINFFAFAYAHLSLQAQKAQNPFGSNPAISASILDLYKEYLLKIAQGDFGKMPASQGEVVDFLFPGAVASAGLLAIAFVISTLLGILLGTFAVKTQPAKVWSLLPSLASLGMAMPGFFVASIFLALSVFYLLNAGPDGKLPIPISGFGWDSHLLFPVLALIVRPSAQIALTTANLLAGELDHQYVVAARSVGNTWKRIRRHNALKNILAPLYLSIAGSFRLMIAELVLVEFIFSWPGLGRLLARTLIPPFLATPGGFGKADIFYLHPPLLAALITLFAFLFLMSDFISSIMAQKMDPRLATSNQEDQHYG